MASRERKRAERHKRKARGKQRREEFIEQYRARSKAKTEAARAELEPLAPAERPLVVTIGAVACALVVLSTVVGFALGLKVNGERVAVGAAVAPVILFGVMGMGMWRARYWAVLGFQAVLGFLILGAALGLTQATNARQVVGTSLLGIGAGVMFWFQVKAMARIQMPDRPGRW